MRTLKKTLSLVLVVAMVLGLCVVGASAKNAVDDYKDADQIGDAYYEAVGVMTGIGVIKGMGDGILSPTGNYTRAQAAKIITYMLIGEKAAESLVCTTAPFEDVAANHWAAGYIAFCVEQGIINGMSATTFEPEGPLTGFQWAKMLLCAVGFGSQGEFTGNSWSLNTAKVAHSVGVFAGDLAGADHVALQRQQAMLYAFNVLTTVPQVTYAPGITGYIEGVVNYKPVTDLGKTLGESVYKLYNVTGVIVDNEAMGNGTTDVAASYTGVDVANIKASTGLDMMWHAAKIWFTGTDAVYTNKVLTTAASGTAVFVTDLAKVTEYCCYDIAAGEKAAAKLTLKAMATIGTGTDYEFDIVDNSAVGQGTATVTTRAYLATLGYASTVNKTTNLVSLDGTTVPVKNDYFKTDISGITSTVTPNVVIEASTKAYHVFAPTATTGAVTKVTKEANNSYTITLSDGTEIKESALTYGNKSAALHELSTDLAFNQHVTPTYYFLLDTHGHYMYLSQDPFRTVAYFTGVTKLSSAHDAWSNAVQYEAQFVDVKTGEIETIPVSNQWMADYFKNLAAAINNPEIWYSIDDYIVDGRFGQWYFDITDELYGDARYYPEAVFGNSNYYGPNGEYAYSGSANFSKYASVNERRITVGEGGDAVDYLYDYNTVVFYIANNAGDKLTVDKYVGVDALLAGYAEKHNTSVSSVTLNQIALTLKDSAAGNKEVATVFAYDYAMANGEYVFFPTDVTWSSVTDDSVAVTGYLNGTKKTEVFKFEANYFIDELNGHLARGFYEYSVDERGYSYVNRMPIQYTGLNQSQLNLETVGSTTLLNGIELESDCIVVDTRKNADVKFDAIPDVATLLKLNQWVGHEQYGSFAIAFMPWPSNNANGSISVIYVVDYNLSIANFMFSGDLADAGWTVALPGAAYEDGYVYLKNDAKLEKIADNTEILLTGKYTYSYSVNDDGAPVYDAGSAKNFADVKATVVSFGDNKYIKVKVSDVAGTTFGSVLVEVQKVEYKVTVTNQATDFVMHYNVNDAYKGAVADNKLELTLNVGDKIALGFHRDGVAQDTVATVTMNGTDTMKVTWGASGNVWTDAFVPETTTVTVNSILANYRYELSENLIKYWGFDVSGVNKTAIFANIVPGDGVKMAIKQLEGKETILKYANPADSAKLNFGGAFFLSLNAVSEATDCVFDFVDVVPGSVTVAADGVTNVVSILSSSWAPDDGHIT